MKITTATLREMKKRGEKITVLTAYDYPLAVALDEVGVEVILVGDSLGNVVLGYPNTLPVTMEEMLHHTKAVARGVKQALLVADMPFMSFQVNPEETLKNAARFVKEAGAEAVKIEGAEYLDAVRLTIRAGIPVMGHIGFTPQSVHQLGGYRVAGKTSVEVKTLLADAKRLEDAGIFSLVLEMVPAAIAQKITRALKIPTISCGSGPHCDGQVLVTYDLLGLYPRKVPRFVKQYANLNVAIKTAVQKYLADVKSGKFPDKEHSF